MVVVGSSLQVWPAAGLPSETLAAGGALAVLNEEATPFDDEATVVVRARAGEALAEVERRLREPSQDDGDAAS
jgi:NAD-dependent deacetylase